MKVLKFPERRTFSRWLRDRAASAESRAEADAFATAAHHLAGGNAARAASSVPARDRATAELLLGRILVARQGCRAARPKRPCRSGDPAAVVRVADLLDVLDALAAADRATPPMTYRKACLRRAMYRLLVIAGPPLGRTFPPPTERAP